MGNVFETVIVTILITLFIFSFTALVMYVNNSMPISTTQEYQQAIQQCEAELPRNQECEAVVTARVKEESDD